MAGTLEDWGEKMSHALRADIKPFLSLPHSDPDYRIMAGSIYSDSDVAISGTGKTHNAIDFDLPRGTEVKAAAAGWAIASYHTFPIMHKDEQGGWHHHTYLGKTINNGLGWHVFIYHPDKKIWSGYGHLERFSPRIKAHAPRKLSEFRYNPIGYKVDPAKLQRYPFAVWVERGEVIGFVGDSGLGWSYIDYPTRPDPQTHPTWDKCHLHFEVFRRFGSRKLKHGYDPYGIDGELESYPDPSRPHLPMGQNGPVLWLKDQSGLPLLAT